MHPLARPASALLVALSMAACAGEPWPEPPPVDADQFALDHEEWRANREERMVTPPGGAVLWSGLWELPEGETPLGSNGSLPIVLPEEDAPPLAGTLLKDGQTVTFAPAEGMPVSIEDGDPVSEPIVLRSDMEDSTTYLAVGSLGLRLHAERGTERLWLRSWDKDMPARDTFRLPDYYPVDPTWRVAARYEEYQTPGSVTLADVTGGLIERRAPGELVFERDGQEHRLITIAEETSSSFFVIVWDSTATRDTYQAGRYMRVAMPDSTGWTTIDFNRTYNAPCVFTAFSVCTLPPRENWLELWVTAGEKRPDVPTY